MKKILLTLSIIFLFIPIAKADLTNDQANDLAMFTTNFINEGNKRIGEEGFPLFAYMQGQARIDGYQSKLYKVSRDYKGINTVNANKWTFDCSSFASFIYYKTFNLVLTKNYLSQTDSYSGLKLRNQNANPYEVKDFFDDASNNEHFYFVKKAVVVKEIDYKELKKGDLIIIKGSHIMVYIGDGNIAHASSGLISSTNLGVGIVNLNNTYGDRTVYVIRVKDKVIKPTLNCNSQILFPDTNEMVNLLSKNEINKDNNPSINYSLSTNEWTKSVDLTLEFSDKIGLQSYSIDGLNYEIKGTKYTLTKTITENKTINIELKNLNNLVKKETIRIKNIDNTPPIIENIQVVEYTDYKQLVVKANDLESGLNVNSYSFDQGETWTYNTFNFNNAKEYNILVKDNVGNVASKNFKYENKEKSMPRINNIIFGEKINDTKKVTITVLDCENCKIAVSTDFKIPTIKNNLVNDEYNTYLKNGKYYIWLESDGKIVDNRTFNVELSHDNTIIISVTACLFSISLIIFGIYIISKRKKNEI